MKWLFTRFKEPSTWAGMSAALPSLLMLAANVNNPAAWASLVGGVAAAIIPEKSQPVR